MEFNKSIIYKMHAINYSIDKIAEEILKDQANLSYTQFLVMVGVYYNQGTTQKFLQDYTLLTNAAVSKILTELNNRKITIRKESKTNRRENAINLTKFGIKTVEKMSKILDLKFQSYMSGLKKNNIENLSDSLEKILFNLNC